MRVSSKLPLMAGVGLGFIAFSSAAPTAPNDTMVTDWSQLTPSTDIDWKPCFQNYTCTRLQVPLDYEDLSVGTAAIAMLKSAAINETKQTRNILVNPGGPGESGVEILMGALSMYREIFGPDFNVIGFDPRGVQHSEPNLDPFHGDLVLATNFVRIWQNINPTVSIEDMHAGFELIGAYGDLAKQELNTSAAYVGTPAVARDMLTMAEKLASMNGEDPKEALVYYHGGSYGSLLGATFATLFPERVGRLAIDAIGDGEDYYSNSWLNNLIDTDKAEQAFFNLCHEAGPDRCVVYEDSAEKIQNRYRKLLLQFKDHPIAVWDKSVAQIPTLATYGQLRQAFLNAAYVAEVNFPVLAQILADLENRNGTSLLAFSGPPCYDCDRTKLQVQTTLPLIGIACVDADGRGNLSTIEAWQKHLDDALSISSYAGEAWAIGALACRKWPFRPPPSQKFDGKFGATTKSPLLLLGNEIDPVCPIQNAYKMASLFPGSVVLSQDTVSHATFDAPSNCTAKYIRKYFESGQLPPANTTCHPNTRPFFGGLA